MIGFFASTIVLWHATFCVNSLAHVLGRRVYDTPDTSRNSAVVALITSGEGWHNNHHRYPWAARQGFRWWQFAIACALVAGVALTWNSNRVTRPSWAVERLAGSPVVGSKSITDAHVFIIESNDTINGSRIFEIT